MCDSNRRPLGGDAELVAMICKEQLGGVIFFEDPLDAHPHTGDIECLNRSIKIYNIMNACNTASATMMMQTLRYGLEQGKPEMLPSFFVTLECPSVAKYKRSQKKVIAAASSVLVAQHIADMASKTEDAAEGVGNLSIGIEEEKKG